MFLKIKPIIGDRKEFLIKRYCRGRVLNVGCGEVHIPGAVNLDRNAQCNPDIASDFHKMPFEDNEFDVAYAFDVIEHTEQPKALVEEMQRVVKSDGRVVVACNDFDIQPQNWNANPEHATYFNEKIFREFFEPKGFSVFSLYRGVLVATNKPKKLNKLFSVLFAIYKRPFNFLKKLIKSNNI